MLYTKDGSIPQTIKEDDSWIEVPDKPDAPEGKEVVWWYPPGWVIRDHIPQAIQGYVWKWNQEYTEWKSYPKISEDISSNTP